MTIKSPDRGQRTDKDPFANARCRCCSRQGLVKILDLGSLPPSDRLLNAEDIGKPLDRYPLELGFCPECSLAQITETVDPELLFNQEYLYFSSFSPALLEHSRKNAEALMRSRRLDENSLVVELASNDGYLLKNFAKAAIPVLGIDPAPKQAAEAEKNGVPTLNAFFSRNLARSLRSQDKRADVIIANNVLAHVADTLDFVAGIAELLKDDGIVSIEAPYIRDLVEKREFDTIYHEHLCYFSLTALQRLLGSSGLHIIDVERVPIHGGSLRVTAGTRNDPSSAVTDLLEKEQRIGLTHAAYYETFAGEVEALRAALSKTIADLKAQGKRIAAYGAAAKGSIMLNTVGLTTEELDFVVDRNSHKHGKFMAGSSLEIFPVEKLVQEMPDYTLLLPWNFRDEILDQQAEYLQRGGKFIIPVPEIEIVSCP